MKESELQIFKLISIAGESKTKAFEALKCVKKGDIKGAKEKIEEARKLDVEAHNIQTEIITKEVSGESSQVSLLAVHAQDHYMTNQLARELIEGIIDLYDK
ncbi:PTS lactose/cellobiose transporter subunit IIA [Clostridium oceanicum]|uniref:PTS lactose/cellobiose transporter subunit IIA n=1 Tax=Clostridium oceanicum TaxID=1543 RepID=A0ABN1JLL9_9CLOT